MHSIVLGYAQRIIDTTLLKRGLRKKRRLKILYRARMNNETAASS